MTQIAWPSLPRLAQRLVLINAWLAGAGTFVECAAEGGFDQAFASLQGVLPGVHLPDDATGSEAPPLEAYFRHAASAVVALNLRPRRGSAADKLVHGYLDGLQAFSCVACTTQPCRWTSTSLTSDVSNLEHGKCLEPLFFLFDRALEAAALAYGKRAACKLHTETLVSRNAALDRAISARALERDSGGERVVELYLHVEDFSTVDYLSAFYVLFHEVFCHVHCGIEIGSTSSVVSTSFSEGWMDFVGQEALLRMLDSGKLLADRAAFDLQLTAFRQQVEILGRRRFDVMAPAAPRSFLYYAVGALAARRFWFLLQGMLLDEGRSWEALLGFSIGVNKSTATDAQRGRLVTSCNTLLQGAETPPQAIATAPEPLVQAIESYLEKPAPSMLMRRILSLAPH